MSLRQFSNAELTFDPASARRTFNICMADASHVTLLPSLLKRVQAVAPNVQISVGWIGKDVVEMLLAGDADLAIGLLPKLDSGFYQQTLYVENWICLVKQGHPRIDEKLTLDTYRSEEHVSVASGPSRMLLEEALTAADLDRRNTVELPGFLGVPAVLAVSNMIATLPRLIGETLANTANLRTFPCPVNVPSYEIRQYWHERYHHDPASQWLRSLCAGLFQRDFQIQHSQTQFYQS
ncbi:LysR substrate-binding domain-containing protein [Phyllobacterium sophorae]|uniref:LysR substrate-binding domain-containing protein n=1 Tax=Phyllobacterium sophorae TaxID=1520277 RepID=UPI001FE0A1A2|nr:LysR substrate-binding domain-containing protein [Phyllobacterium sophorae]